MTIDKILSSYTQSLTSTQSYFIHGGKDDFASKLTLGQVIEARVMRHHEGSRYSVNIQGKERIIDSANPLQAGELIEGRVKSLGQQVEIQRIHTLTDQANTPSERTPSTQLQAGTPAKPEALLIQQLFADKQAQLSKQEMTLLQNLLKTNPSTNAITLSALAIKKANVDLTKDTVTAVAKALTDINPSSNRNLVLDTAILEIEARTEPLAIPKDVVKGLSENIKSFAFLENNGTDATLEGKMPSSFDFSQDNQDKDLAQWILNIQDEGSMNHRLMSFPIWLGDKLTEVKMALFDQEQSNRDIALDRRPFKKVVFTVNLDALGTITVSSTAHGANLSMTLSCDNKQATDYIARYGDELKGVANSMDWNVDRLEYATQQPSEYDDVTHAVVEHYINKDSVSRLI